ncbi:11447_t:CDS:2 [Acaulospora morrowiae]|uniref:11447_t:CDS:1 n=1 Tax=Acaulospora morrowiae TaxID=94023 RepID=A0A9N9C345_9GLOM|nr:11447_t:CDS:2 [Acaulospora morrowiae]
MITLSINDGMPILAAAFTKANCVTASRALKNRQRAEVMLGLGGETSKECSIWSSAVASAFIYAAVIVQSIKKNW